MFPVMKIPKLLIFVRFFNNEESEFPGFSFFYRKITVEAVSKKRSMDLRLLHGVAYGHP